MGRVGSIHESGWVGLGHKFSVLGGSGWVGSTVHCQIVKYI